MAEQKKPKVGFELEKEEATYSHHGIILIIFFFPQERYIDPSRDRDNFISNCVFLSD